MRSVLPALVLAAVAAGPAVAEPFITPGVVAGAVVPALVSAAVEASVSRTYARGPYVHTPSGTYVQYYDPRTGIPVGGPVAVSSYEFARRAARVPADAPVIRVRATPYVTDEGIEPVMRPHRHLRPHLYGARFHGPRPYVHGPRYGARVYAPGPRYHHRHGGPRYHAGVYAPGPRLREPIYVGPRRFAPAQFRHGRHVPGYTVVPRRLAPHHRPHMMPHRFGRPAHHRMGPPPGHRVGAPHPGHRGPMHHGRRS